MTTYSYARTRRSWLGRHFGQLMLHATLLLLSFIFLVPLWVVVAASFTDEVALTRNGYGLWPSVFSSAAYDYIFNNPDQIVRAYGVTIFITVVGTLLALFINSMTAYTLARLDFSWRHPASFILFFTMLFNGGLVPSYILITQYLKLRDTLWVLILPMLVNPWYIFLLRPYFSGLAKELIDAAKIDGAREFQIYAGIIMPLSTPALATIALFLLLGFWNEWWLALRYINDPNLYPLLYLLVAILRNAEFLSSQASSSSMLGSVQVPLQPVRMAMAVIAVGPIAIAFVALQRYFVRGLTVGGVKGE